MEAKSQFLIINNLTDVVKHEASNFFDFLDQLRTNTRQVGLQEELEQPDVVRETVALKKEDDCAESDSERGELQAFFVEGKHEEVVREVEKLFRAPNSVETGGLKEIED